MKKTLNRSKNITTKLLANVYPKTFCYTFFLYFWQNILAPLRINL